MTAKPRFKFKVQLEEELLNDEGTKGHFYNSFSGAAPSDFGPLTPEQAEKGLQAGMYLRGLILNHHFWLSTFDEADELWKSEMLPNLRETIDRTLHKQKVYLRSKPQAGIVLEPFERLDVLLEPYYLSFADMRRLEPGIVVDAIKQIRVLLNDGTFDSESLQRIDIPAIPAKEPEGAEAESDEGLAEETAAPPAVEDDAEKDDTVLSEDAVPDAEDLDDPEAPATTDEAQAVEEEEPEPVDYTIWNLSYRDGSQRLFDSANSTWVEIE
jgi:hypothetical protein